MAEPTTIRVEVAYATPAEQVIVEVIEPPPLTVEAAIRHSGVLERFPEIDLDQNKVGIFGKATRADVLLREGDRVEIYRPLMADPKETRRKRAAEGKGMRKGGS